MSAETIVIIMVLVLLVSLAIGNWVFVALGISGVIGLMLTSGSMLKMIGPIVWGAVYNTNLAAVPLFIFMGEIILLSGISDGLYKGAAKWLGNWPGGLLHTNVISCAFFAAISGSSMATTATIGTVAMPKLKTRHYNKQLILGSIAASGTLGILIPPSINMIVYGAWVECSIGQLFAGGLIPGIMMAMGFMAYISIRAIRNPSLAPRESSSWGEKLDGIKGMAPILFLVIFIFAAIYTGVMTPTETAGIASFLVLIIALIMRRFSWRMVNDSMLSALRVSCMILLVYVGAKIMVFVLTFGGVPSKIPMMIAGAGLSKLQVLFLLYLTYILLGCFMDGISMIVLTMPFVMPILLAFNISLVWFGVMLIVLTEMGMITPPMGMALYVVLGLDRKVTLGEISKAILPFLAIQAGIVVLLTFAPDVAMFLPSLMAT